MGNLQPNLITTPNAVTMLHRDQPLTRDDRVSIPLEPEVALRGLLNVDPPKPSAD